MWAINKSGQDSGLSQAPPATWLIPLSLAVTCGGPLCGFYKSLAQMNQTIFLVEIDYFRSGKINGEQKKALRQIGTEWLLSYSHCAIALNGGSEAEFENLFPQVCSRSFVSIPNEHRMSIQDWISVIDPDLDANDSNSYDENICHYLKELPEAQINPWEGLRFFSGFLKRNKSSRAHRFARKWAGVQALHSPQDEKSERETLQQDEIMLNPTLQIVVGDQIECAWRWENELVTENLNFTAAAIIDEMFEAGRINKNNLKNLVLDHQKARCRDKAGVNASAIPIDVDTAISDLIQRGVLLARFS